jgi:hypothetical protein
MVSVLLRVFTLYCTANYTYSPPPSGTKCICTEQFSSVGDPLHFGADPDPDPTPFFSDFKDEKKLFFSYFFTKNLPTGTLC